MTTQELSTKAIAIMETVDFWRYDRDYTYCAGHASSAKEAMKLFVKITNEIGGELREALRDAWIARHKWSRLVFPGLASEQTLINRKEAESVYNSKLGKVRALMSA